MSTRDVEITQSETVIMAVDFHPNLVLRHLDESIVVTDKRLVVRFPRTIFGVFILGYFERSVTWDNVDTVIAGRHVRTRRLLVGLGILILSLFYGIAVLVLSGGPFSTFNFGGLLRFLVMMLIAAVGLWVVLSSYDRVVGCVSGAGGSAAVRVGSGEMAQMEALATLLRVVITQRTVATPAPGSAVGSM